jgi:pyridinium-3,5-biscarboxylic acid mononucleotide synthase
VNTEQLQHLLNSVANGDLSARDALTRLRSLPFEQLPFATLDHHRSLRCGHGEVIFCAGKTTDQVCEIARKLSANNSAVLATRASENQLDALYLDFPTALIDEQAGAALINPPKLLDPSPTRPPVAVVSAGTSDGPVAAEAMITLRSMSVPAIPITDVGIAGLHRLLHHVPTLQNCCAIVAIAGMEGALPSVVGGLVGCPVFAVPTSVGYGANLSGLAPLFAMLNSCASNVSVVNIDNGFGAALSASLVHHQILSYINNGK